MGDILFNAVMLELLIFIGNNYGGLPLGMSNYFDLKELTGMCVDLKNREVLFFS